MHSIVNQLPMEILSMIVPYIEYNDQIRMLHINKSFNELITQAIWRKPNWDMLSLESSKLEPLLQKYGKMVRVIPISDKLNDDCLQLILKECPNIHTLYFYGNLKLWDKVKDNLGKKLETVEIYTFGDFEEDSWLPLAKLSYLSSLTITYDDCNQIVEVLKKLRYNQLKHFTGYQITRLSYDLISTLYTKFPSLATLHLQAIEVEPSAIPTFNQTMSHLKSFELDISFFSRSNICMFLNAGNFPSLERLFIDHHGSRGDVTLSTEGEWKNLKVLTIFEVNTGDDIYFVYEDFPNLTELSLQGYKPFNQNTLYTVLTELSNLTSIDLSKLDLKDSDFDFPSPVILKMSEKITHFNLSNMKAPMGKEYLGFVLRYMTGITEWAIPELIQSDIEMNFSRLDQSENNQQFLTDSYLANIESQMDQFLTNLSEMDAPNIMPNLAKLYVDVSYASIPLAHYLVQACSKLNYLYLNIMNDICEQDVLKEEFLSVKPDLVLKID